MTSFDRSMLPSSESESAHSLVEEAVYRPQVSSNTPAPGDARVLLAASRSERITTGAGDDDSIDLQSPFVGFDENRNVFTKPAEPPKPQPSRDIPWPTQSVADQLADSKSAVSAKLMPMAKLIADNPEVFTDAATENLFYSGCFKTDTEQVCQAKNFLRRDLKGSISDRGFHYFEDTRTKGMAETFQTWFPQAADRLDVTLRLFDVYKNFQSIDANKDAVVTTSELSAQLGADKFAQVRNTFERISEDRGGTRGVTRDKLQSFIGDELVDENVRGALRLYAEYNPAPFAGDFCDRVRKYSEKWDSDANYWFSRTEVEAAATNPGASDVERQVAQLVKGNFDSLETANKSEAVAQRLLTGWLFESKGIPSYSACSIASMATSTSPFRAWYSYQPLIAADKEYTLGLTAADYKKAMFPLLDKNLLP